MLLALQALAAATAPAGGPVVSRRSVMIMSSSAAPLSLISAALVGSVFAAGRRKFFRIRLF